MTKPIGILGGTFDPIHNGHLKLATRVFQRCDLSEIRLIPVHTPSHRQIPFASIEQRLHMLQLAIENYDGLIIDEREIQRGEISYTVDTLGSLREDIGQDPLCLIMGADAFQTISSWHKWSSIIDHAHIIVAGRPGTEKQVTLLQISELFDNMLTTTSMDLHKGAAGKIFYADIEEIDISSSRVRELIGSQKQVFELVPESVLTYIMKEDLYHRH
jgi:nicotinate-nucleotide adenylyltransferase